MVDKKKVTVLCTGAGGFIGTHAVDLLLNKGYKVIAFDNLLVGPEAISQFYDKEDFIFVNGDITDKEDLEVAFSYLPDHVIHLAGIVGNPACNKDLERSFKVNATGARLLAELCLENGVKHLVNASTCSIYGNQLGVVDEKGAEIPCDFYGQTKLSSERLIDKILPKEMVTHVRYATAYGLSKRMRFDLVVNTFCLKAVLNNKLTVFGNGEQRRPFTHCNDLARSAVFLMENKLSGIYNIVGQNYKIKDLALLLKRKMPDLEVNFETQMEDWRDYEVKNDKILATGFKFNYTVEQGVDEILSFIDKDNPEEYLKRKYYNVQLI
jgi:nucleoside-diphosphate-sugar epimerase